MKKQKAIRKNSISIRFTQEEYDTIVENWHKSSCRYLSQFLYKKLFNKPIRIKYRNESLDELIFGMGQLRRELKSLEYGFNEKFNILIDIQEERGFQESMQLLYIEKQLIIDKLSHLKSQIEQISQEWLKS